MKKNYETLFGVLAVVFALAFLCVGAHDVWEQPEVVTETVEVEVEVPAECEVCPEVEECPVVECPEVNETLCVDFVDAVEDDLVEENDARNEARDEIESEMDDNDFVEDVFDFLVNDLGLDVNDEDDVSLENVAGFEWDYDWSDVEDGDGEVVVEFKAYYIEDGDEDDEKLECLFVLDEFEVDSYTISEH
ncbi:MAG: hypothetical protein Unbinned1693contig1002_35 [Prokaryotic dsDNA virus sp.]|jgi:hypothetical protein|nr:MAG: hypothetical protein Unbinned1693contig1002_35 [Prokaryotic dsDNA virus sp.]|tara:strand:+ start:4381 stop:4950 length:570 start_codon:yes stop_codon:yes gene_type:complete